MDAELGFLHTFRGLEAGVAVETMALQDLRLDATVDDATFTVEPRQGVRVERTAPRAGGII